MNCSVLEQNNFARTRDNDTPTMGTSDQTEDGVNEGMTDMNCDMPQLLEEGPGLSNEVTYDSDVLGYATPPHTLFDQPYTLAKTDNVMSGAEDISASSIGPSLPDASKDLESADAERGKCAMYNLGNTCFLNAGLQSLFANNSLTNYMLSDYPHTHPTGGCGDPSLTGALYRLFEKVWSGRYSLVYPVEFKQILATHHSQFSDFAQHDCQEFLAVLLGSLHEQLNTAVKRPPQNNTTPTNATAPDVLTNQLNTAHKPTVSKRDSLAYTENLHSVSNLPLTGATPVCAVKSSPAWSITGEDSNMSNCSVMSSDYEQSESLRHLSLKSSESSVRLISFRYLDPDSDQCGMDTCAGIRCDRNSLHVVHGDCDTCDMILHDMDTCNVVRGDMDACDIVRDDMDACDVVRGDMDVCDVVRGDMEVCDVVRGDMDACDLVRGDMDACDIIRAIDIVLGDDGGKEQSGLDDIEARSVDCDVSGEVLHRRCDDTVGFGDQLRFVKTVELSDDSVMHVTNLVCDPSSIRGSEETCGQRSGDNDVVMNNETMKHLPSLSDICDKDTRTLNTNVLVSEYMHETIATDSVKFTKPDNLNRPPCEELLNNRSAGTHGAAMKAKATVRVKDTNVYMNRKTKNKPGEAARVLDDTSDRRKVKRMKFECAETNIKRRAMCKVRGDKNLALRAMSYVPNVLESSGEAVLSDSDSPSDESMDELAESTVIPGGQPGAGIYGRAPYRDRDIEAADRMWEAYMEENRSVVVDTFQGQFNSTVTCSVCQHLSVTFEAFMYLSVPLPHAMDRQICVTLVSRAGKATRFAVTLNKNDHVRQLHQGLVSMVTALAGDVILAEVQDARVVRVLDENILLRYVSDSQCEIYAFEMSPPPPGVSASAADKSPSSTGEIAVVTVRETGENPKMGNVVMDSGDGEDCDVNRNGITKRIVNTVGCECKLSTSDRGGPSTTTGQSCDSCAATMTAVGDGNDYGSTKACSSNDRTILDVQPHIGASLRGAQMISTHGGHQRPSNLRLDLVTDRSSPRVRTGYNNGISDVYFGNDFKSVPTCASSSPGVISDSTPRNRNPASHATGTIASDSGPVDTSMSPNIRASLSHPVTQNTESDPEDYRDDDSDLNPEFDPEANTPDADPELTTPNPDTPQRRFTSNTPSANIDDIFSQVGEWRENATPLSFISPPVATTTAVDTWTSNAQAVVLWSGQQTVAPWDSGGGGGDGSTATVVNQWRNCAICLEDHLDSYLLTHVSCGCTLCHSCLERSMQHYGAHSYCCPMCSSVVNPTVDFVSLAAGPTQQCAERTLLVPVTFRCETEDNGRAHQHLFGHPRLVYLPSEVLGETLYEYTTHITPVTPLYYIVLTDSQGLHCSRCPYTDHCSGCVITRDATLTLHPGDHLTLVMSNVDQQQLAMSGRVVSDASMADLRSNEPLTLADCFSAFTKSEVLDEHNPWFCPHCRLNQRATKTITIWRYPDTLIIYLKRFVFHQSSSTKIDTKVVFPSENLDLTDFISGPRTKSLAYDLTSTVCHFGGVNAGHYTTYSKHPVTQQWWYYNDETVSQVGPDEDDFSSAYVLFYQRKDTETSMNIADDRSTEDNASGQTSNDNTISILNNSTDQL